MTQQTQQLTGAATASGARTRWWRDAVIYQVYVRSFADSDGDGIGDLRGIEERLPYLAELGADAVWLTPFYASPQADGAMTSPTTGSLTRCSGRCPTPSRCCAPRTGWGCG